MAKTPAERMREMRERKRKAAVKAEKALAPTIYQQAFSDFVGGRSFADHRLILGNEWWDFSSDDGIKPLSDDTLDADEKHDASNSLGKAELILNVLEDIATTLASDIHDYKLAQIRARFEEVALEQPTDEAHRERIVAESARLIRMEQQLDKEVRWTFPQWKVTGD